MLRLGRLFQNANKLNISRPSLNSASNNCRNFHFTPTMLGFEEFFDTKKAGEEIHVGRSWQATDLRRKSNDDLHKLWYVLYKERNLLLSERERLRRNLQPVSPGPYESRYIKVKRSMQAIKYTLSERKKIEDLLAGKQIVKKVRIRGHNARPLGRKGLKQKMRGARK